MIYDPDVHGSAEEFIREHKPHRYAALSTQVALAMDLSARRCTGSGCDEDRPCPRHARVPEVVSRLLRMRARAGA